MRIVEKVSRFLRDTWSFFSDKPHGRARLTVFSVIWGSYGAILSYEIFQPAFYVGSLSSKIAPILVWLAPPIILVAFFLEIQKNTISKNEVENGRR